MANARNMGKVSIRLSNGFYRLSIKLDGRRVLVFEAKFIALSHFFRCYKRTQESGVISELEVKLSYGCSTVAVIRDEDAVAPELTAAN